jgi:TRAP-type C4-dicarboxylate transport system permease small subunit
MKPFTNFITGFSQQLDKIAGLCIVGIMVLVVCNVVLRAVLTRPILGTYELVSLLTAVSIALALANCAINNAHIAVDFVVDRFPLMYQAISDSIINLTAIIFWGFSAWHLGQYANKMIQNGIVSSTAQIPIYPVIYLIALGLITLCLVLIIRWLDALKNAFACVSITRSWLPGEWGNNTRKAMR